MKLLPFEASLAWTTVAFALASLSLVNASLTVKNPAQAQLPPVARVKKAFAWTVSIRNITVYESFADCIYNPDLPRHIRVGHVQSNRVLCRKSPKLGLFRRVFAYLPRHTYLWRARCYTSEHLRLGWDERNDFISSSRDQ